MRGAPRPPLGEAPGCGLAPLVAGVARSVLGGRLMISLSERRGEVTAPRGPGLAPPPVGDPGEPRRAGCGEVLPPLPA